MGRGKDAAYCQKMFYVVCRFFSIAGVYLLLALNCLVVIVKHNLTCSVLLKKYLQYIIASCMQIVEARTLPGFSSLPVCSENLAVNLHALCKVQKMLLSLVRRKALFEMNMCSHEQQDYVHCICSVQVLNARRIILPSLII